MRFLLALLLLIATVGAVGRRARSQSVAPVIPRATFPVTATFGQLAGDLGGPEFQASWKLLSDLTNASLPSSSLGTMRDALMDVRDVLDAFVFSYPLPENSSYPDIWRLLREDLNYGYTWIGNYIDLSTVNYSQQVQQAYLEKLLAWKATYEQHAVTHNYSQYIAVPDPTNFYWRNDSELSSMYWGNQTVYTPSPNNTGLANVALLELAMILKHHQRYFVLVSLPNITTVPWANYMHDYKKQIRAMMTVVRWFPQIYNWSSPFAQPFMNVSTQCHEVLGYTHSFIIRWLYYNQYGPPEQAANAAVQVDEAFYAMKEYLAKIAWPDQLDLFRSVVLTDPR